MSNFVEKLPKLGFLVAGYAFVGGVFLFGFAYFTVSIPDPNAYVNSQATIIHMQMALRLVELVLRIELL